MNKLYNGSQSLYARGFSIGQEVKVGGFYPEKKGKIIELNRIELPFEAKVQLNGGKAFWIKSKYLQLSEKDEKIRSKNPRQETSLYTGTATAAERGLTVGSQVNVGADFAKRFGVITRIDPLISYRVQVSLGRKGKSFSWINLCHLSKRPINDVYNPLEIIALKLANNYQTYIEGMFIFQNGTKETRSKKIQLFSQALLYGFENNLLSKAILAKAIDLFSKHNTNPSISMGELNLSIDKLSRATKEKLFSTNLWLSEQYDNPKYSDVKFDIKGEIIHAHRIIIGRSSLFSSLISKPCKIVVEKDETAFQVKKELQGLYRNPLEPIDIRPSDFSPSYSGADKFYDFTFRCGKEKLPVHKIWLARFSYFDSVFQVGIEAVEKGELELEPGQFQELKILVEFLYSKKKPNNISNLDFEKLLDFYGHDALFE